MHDFLNIDTCFDIGSSSGDFVDELNKLGIDSEGIESDAWKIKSTKVKHGSFDLNYPTKKYDMITLPQVIYFIGELEEVLIKLKSMLNPNGQIFIISAPVTFHYPISTGIKTYEVPTTKEEYYEICQRLGFKIIDYSRYQSDIAVAFNDRKILAVLRLISYAFKLKKPITKNSDGNMIHLLLKMKNPT